MTEKVDLYGRQYGNFVSDLYAAIRAESFGEDIGQNGWLSAEEQDLFIAWMRPSSGGQVLDVACGSGGPSLRLAEKTGCRLRGVDVNADAISTAKELAAQRGLTLQVEFIEIDGSELLPFPDQSFDAIICVDAINHLPDRPKVLADWFRLLKPGGRLIFTDPIVVSGCLTNEEIAIRSSIGYFLFVPEGLDDRWLREAGFHTRHREDRTANMALQAARWREARDRHEKELRKVEGDDAFEGQQRFFEVAARLAREGRLSRLAYGVERPV